ncbi:MAG TPA: NACHT domain-containing protein [Microbacterium sp.]|nr:NACHT domain-containing protein [Microbacterium sp.]
MSDATSVGGAANELGSRHRAGVATYLAVHGLVDREVLGRPGAVPIAISLEAAEAVDDIVCRMADDTRWFSQSKRTAGNSEPFRAAVRQWAQQQLEHGDRVVLVARELRGLLSGLQPSIDQVVRGDPVPDNARTKVEQFVGVLRDDGVADPELLLGRVQLIEWRVETPGDPDQEAGIAMLADSIVPFNQAPRAFEVLRARMLLAATRRETTTVGDWIDCLVAADLDVYADGAGPRGARERARQLATASYRAHLARRANRLDLSALVTDVPEIIVEDALDAWEVSWDASGPRQIDKTDVLNVIRATPRVVIVGLPGMGKSELMRQLAARLAQEPLAPVPIHIDLRNIASAVRSADDLTLDLLLELPSRSVTGQDAGVLKSALTDAVTRGDAILQIDGLDEAQRARGQVAAGLARLLAELPPATGLTLTTRDSALASAEQLHLPLVRLEPPGNLRDAMLTLITELAPQHGAADSTEWIAGKNDELIAAFGSHKDVWSVPLLATLATVRLASGRGEAESVAVLLNQVIEDSVSEWELRRAAGRDELHTAVDSPMLLEGFAAIGHELVGRASISRAEAATAVRAALAAWHLAPPVEGTVAAQIVNFWDERVGVFVDNGDAIVPRSRQFAELAEVRWLSDRTKAHRSEWLQNAVQDDSYENAVSLATILHADVRAALIHRASRVSADPSRDRAATWVARQWRTWPAADQSQQLQIIDVLADAAEDQLPSPGQSSGILRAMDANRRRTDGDGWEFVLALVNAPRIPGVDDRRRERLANLDVDLERRTMVTALDGLIDASAEGRAPDAETLAAVEEILSVQVPAEPGSQYNEEGVLVIKSSPSFVTGVGDIAERCIEFLDRLPLEAPDAVYAIARKQSIRQYARINRRLVALGHRDPQPAAAASRLLDMLEAFDDDHGGLAWLLRALVQLSPDIGSEPGASWRYPNVGRLIDALGYAETTIQGLARAAEEDANIVQGWLVAHIEAFGLDVAVVAAEADQLIDADDSKAASDSIIYGRRQSEEDPATLTEPTALALVPALRSRSEWIVNSSFRLLTQTRYPSVATAVAEIPGRTSWRTRFERNIAIVYNAADAEAAVVRMVASENTAVRSAAAAMLALDYVPRSDLLDGLRDDGDGQVRYYAGGEPRNATEWTCSSCAEVNTTNHTSCSRCHVTAAWR